ncbi:MAG: sulfatase-like hydrolase/transferase [Verrucomicrobiales bacterium]|nr:sulfatase-like hydrolase/transferase [Verrucomicrobiales bacterium]
MNRVKGGHAPGIDDILMKTNRYLFVTVAVVLGTGAIAGAIAGAAETAAKPNMVFLLADDLRFNALGCYGDPIAQTPHIDRLARRGTLFRNAFVTTSICAVSRATFFTGQWMRRHVIEDFATGLNGAAWSNSYVQRRLKWLLERTCHCWPGSRPMRRLFIAIAVLRVGDYQRPLGRRMDDQHLAKWAFLGEQTNSALESNESCHKAGLSPMS